MNSDESAPANVEYLRRCEVCDQQFLSGRRNARCCRRHECHATEAEFAEFYTLQSILGMARWAGAPSEDEMRAKYYEERMWEAMRRLPHSEDPLAAVLVEILGELHLE
jgi:hypothetical protein